MTHEEWSLSLEKNEVSVWKPLASSPAMLMGVGHHWHMRSDSRTPEGILLEQHTTYAFAKIFSVSLFSREEDTFASWLKIYIKQYF